MVARTRRWGCACIISTVCKLAVQNVSSSIYFGRLKNLLSLTHLGHVHRTLPCPIKLL